MGSLTGFLLIGAIVKLVIVTRSYNLLREEQPCQRPLRFSRPEIRNQDFPHKKLLEHLVWEGFPECTFVRQMFGSGRVTDIWGRDLSMLGACQEGIDTYSMFNYKV